MKNFFIVMAALCMLFTPSDSFAKQKIISGTNAENIYSIATVLAECGGAYAAIGEISTALSAENAAKTMIDTGMGAYLAGAFLIYASNTIPEFESAIEYTKNIHDSEKTRWLGSTELRIAAKQKKLIPRDLEEKMGFCLAEEIRILQADLLDLMRRSL